MEIMKYIETSCIYLELQVLIFYEIRTLGSHHLIYVINFRLQL